MGKKMEIYHNLRCSLCWFDDSFLENQLKRFHIFRHKIKLLSSFIFKQIKNLQIKNYNYISVHKELLLLYRTDN